jgi:hypothetical protein
MDNIETGERTDVLYLVLVDNEFAAEFSDTSLQAILRGYCKCEKTSAVKNKQRKFITVS